MKIKSENTAKTKSAGNDPAELTRLFTTVRQRTETICRPLQREDYVVQPVVDVSPPKWHLGHSTWFFERFLLREALPGYREFDDKYNFIFNSYYETIGSRVQRTDRGNLSRPTVDEIYRYRQYVDKGMLQLLQEFPSDYEHVLLLGINHEQQHQELLLTDIKYILGHNPLFPAYNKDHSELTTVPKKKGFIAVEEGFYIIGYTGNGFCFDNERAAHKVWLPEFTISSALVSNGEYLDFIDDGGYKNFRHWHAEGWDWVKQNNIASPLYWHNLDGHWFNYTLSGLSPVDWEQPVCHLSYYEANAYAAWKHMRLPTEFEWEAASGRFSHGLRWEWTDSAYLPYTGFSKSKGAIGEYNGKFMINQMVLRGGSVATAQNHCRASYRNFFHPWLRWQYAGIRLCKQNYWLGNVASPKQ